MADDEPPPLEDMTKDLERMGRISSRYASPQQNDTNSNSVSSSTRGAVLSKTSDINKPVKKKSAQESKGFCGFQKGFLSGSSKNPRNTTKSSSSSSEAIKESHKASQHVDDIIRPKNTSGKSGLELPEVQDAMRETYPALATDSKHNLTS